MSNEYNGFESSEASNDVWWCLVGFDSLIVLMFKIEVISQPLPNPPLSIRLFVPAPMSPLFLQIAPLRRYSWWSFFIDRDTLLGRSANETKAKPKKYLHGECIFSPPSSGMRTVATILSLLTKPESSPCGANEKIWRSNQRESMLDFLLVHSVQCQDLNNIVLPFSSPAPLIKQ